MIFILYTGAQWSMLPEKYGNYKTVHGKFMRWVRLGVFQKIMVKAREYYTGDSAFDVKELRNFCKKKNTALIATPNKRRKKNVHKFNPPYRWIVEQSLGFTSWFRGLKVCWSKTFESANAMLQIYCSLRLFKMGGILR